MAEPSAPEPADPTGAHVANRGKLDTRAARPKLRWRSGALLSVLAAFVVLGLPEGILGTAWPGIRAEFGRANSSLALLLTGFTVGYTTSSAASGHLTDKLGPARMLGFAIATSAAGVAALVAAPGFAWMVAAYVVLGLGNGTIDSVSNAWTALARGPRAMGMLHAAFGVGATIGPLMSAGLISAGTSWRWPFGVLLAGQALAIALIWSNRQGFTETLPHAGAKARNGQSVDSSRWMLPLMLLWFGTYVGVEVAIGQWSFTLLTQERDLSDRAAGALVSAYWGGLTVGRLGLGGLGHKLKPERLMTGATILAAISIEVLWSDPAGLGAAGLPIIGLAFAPMFPVMVGRTPEYLGADRSNRAVGYQLAASSLGVVTTPLLIGVLADHHGIGVAPPVAFGAVILLGGVWAATAAAARRSVVGSGERTGQR